MKGEGTVDITRRDLLLILLCFYLIRAQNEDAIKKYEDSLKRRHWKMLKEYYIVMKTERVRSDYKQLIKATILYK